jgi:hypothetical protein
MIGLLCQTASWTTLRASIARLLASRPPLPEPPFCEGESEIEALLNVPMNTGEEPVMGFPRCKLNTDNLVHLADGGQNIPLLHSLEAGIVNSFTTNSAGLSARKSRPAASALSREFPDMHRQKHEKEWRSGHFGKISEETLARLPAFSFTPEHVVCQNGKFRLISDKKASRVNEHERPESFGTVNLDGVNTIATVLRALKKKFPKDEVLLITEDITAFYCQFPVRAANTVHQLVQTDGRRP